MKVLDLFSGLGGFSEGFARRGHQVVRVDNDKRFADVPHTTICDAREFVKKKLDFVPDVVVMSPPCQCFSIAQGRKIHERWRGGMPISNCDEVLDAVHLAVWAYKYGARSGARFWVLENPRGMMRCILGLPPITTYWGAWGAPYCKPTDLWGRLPPVEWPTRPVAGVHYPPSPRGSKNTLQTGGIKFFKKPRNNGLDFYNGKNRAALRALIPYKFSEALCIACEGAIS